MPGSQRALLFLLIGSLLPTLGCELAGPGSIEADADAPPIKTEKTEYLLRQDGPLLRTEIPYVYTNATHDTVYVSNCRGGFLLSLQRKEADGWVNAYGNGRRDCLSPPIVIEPDGTFEDTLAVYAAPHGSNHFPQFDRSDPTGTYRIAWGEDALSSWQGDYPFGNILPLELRISNTFQLKVESAPRMERVPERVARARPK